MSTWGGLPSRGSPPPLHLPNTSVTTSQSGSTVKPNGKRIPGKIGNGPRTRTGNGPKDANSCQMPQVAASSFTTYVGITGDPSKRAASSQSDHPMSSSNTFNRHLDSEPYRPPAHDAQLGVAEGRHDG
jgi:hypothetical protein